MDWCIQPEYSQANHNPLAILNQDATKKILKIQTTKNGQVPLTAVGSQDPDGDQISITWFIYPEAGTEGVAGQLDQTTGEEVILSIAPDSREGDMHVILQVEDHGSPSLVAYRRAIVQIKE
jgi:hypothetical protein